MKKIFLTLLSILAVLPIMAKDAVTDNAVGIKGIEIKKLDGEALHIANSVIRSMRFVEGNALFTAVSGETLTIPRSDIETISSLDKIATEYCVSYNGDGNGGLASVAGAATATVINPYAFQGVTTDIEGGYVTTTNLNEAEELTFSLSGTTPDGSYTYNGSYKCTLKLNGVNIKSNRGAAIDIKCGKRIAVVLVEGTENTLEDSVEGEQKAAMYFKGHPEFEKGGTLNVKGNCRHAISSKEYIQLKKSVGQINILTSKSDGIHAGQYFQMNGGSVTIDNVLGDGIQAEITNDPTDEQNGQMIIKGGTINIKLTAEDVSGLKSDSLMSISSGDITINVTGAADKCIKSKTDLVMTDGTLALINSGNGETINNEDETAKGLSVDGNLILQGGSLDIKMTGTGGKGIKVDGTFTMGDKETGLGPKLTISTTGAKFNGTGSSSGGQNPGPWGPGGGGHPGGGGGWPGQDSSGSSAKAIKVEGVIYIYGGETIVTTATSGAEGLESKTEIYIEGGHHYFKCYDDCINSKGCIYFNGGVTVCYTNGNDAVDSNAGKTGAITIGDGVILAYTTKGSPEEGLDCDNNNYIQIKGKGIAISAGGSQGGWGGGSSSNTITNPAQGYNFLTNTINYQTGRYYTLSDADGKNLVTYSFDANVNSTLSLITATGMTKGSTYTIKYSTEAPSDAQDQWHGLYLGSTAKGTTNVTSFTAK